ncbi:hypothetical protein K469DRAFT_707675, partial [Zopfia rhizophila CBS 207.26]
FAEESNRSFKRLLKWRPERGKNSKPNPIYHAPTTRLTPMFSSTTHVSLSTWVQSYYPCSALPPVFSFTRVQLHHPR